jgi:AcrR family transcriptional regulator
MKRTTTTARQPRRKKQPSVKERRRYDSPVRRRQAQETRARIVLSGAEIVHGLPTWDWDTLTFRAVAEKAGVSERTVHRHFPTERKLRDAVLHGLMQESGITLQGLELDNFAQTAARLFAYLSSFAIAPQPLTDPTFAAIDRSRREALVAAVGRAARNWSAAEREAAAAVLDIFWNVQPYERLLGVWGFDVKRATGAATWAIGLIEDAIRRGRRPPPGG